MSALNSKTHESKDICSTWHAHIEMSEGDLSFCCPFESMYVFCVGKPCPKILLWSQSHQTNEKSILISEIKYVCYFILFQIWCVVIAFLDFLSKKVLHFFRNRSYNTFLKLITLKILSHKTR